MWMFDVVPKVAVAPSGGTNPPVTHPWFPSRGVPKFGITAVGGVDEHLRRFGVANALERLD